MELSPHSNDKNSVKIKSENHIYENLYIYTYTYVLLLITYNTLFQRPCNTLDTGIYLKTKIKDKRAYTPLSSF